MTWQATLFFGLSLLTILALFFYWAIWIAEGAYFGAWAVRLLYDWGASTYDQVKEFDELDEASFLANPLFSRLEENAGPHSLLLDVATGTARLPVGLFKIPFYEGEIIGLDASRGMLSQAAEKTKAHQERITFLHHSSVPLPFDSEIFDMVTSLEALEFMPDRYAALREMERVLRPGGWLIVTNRIGTDARLMPTRTDSPAQFEQFLTSMGLVEVFTRPWQEYYDLIFARKPGTPQPGNGFNNLWQLALRCPRCHTSSGDRVSEEKWRCAACDEGVISIASDGIWNMSS